MVSASSFGRARTGNALVLGAGIALAVVIAAAIAAVQRAHDDASARIQLLTRVDEVNAELDGVLWESVALGGATAGLRGEARRNLEELGEVSEELAASGAAPGSFTRDLDRYSDLVTLMVDRLAAGDVDGALGLHRAAVDRVFDRLDREAEALTDHETTRAARLEWIALLTTFALLLVGACSAAVVFARYERARRLAHRAYHDPLTGLANRALFFDRTSHALTLARRRNEFVAVALLDLDEFKLVNDSLGHGFGDQLIVEVGKRLVGHARESDTVARLGGDEFALLVEGVRGPDVVDEIATRFDELFAVPFTIDGRELRVRATVGWALGDVAGSVDELLRNADLAMYAGKRQGKDRSVVFEAAMHRELLERLELEGDLRDALDNGEIALHYQPIVSLETGQIVGVEALARWEHPTRGFVPPVSFIPIAEQAGLIVPIGRWVLIEACRQVRQWQLAYPMHPPLSVAVNVSPVQLQTREIVADVVFALRESGLDPAALELEITESVIVDRTDEFASRLDELSALGVRLAIDDFGTGYSSLSQLNHLPVDTFKIDRSFLQGVLENGDRAALLRSVIELGRSLGLVSIAEGVEEADEGSTLRGFGCTLAQGYHYSRPLPANAIEAMFAAEEGNAADARRVARVTSSYLAEKPPSTGSTAPVT